MLRNMFKGGNYSRKFPKCHLKNLRSVLAYPGCFEAIIVPCKLSTEILGLFFLAILTLQDWGSILAHFLGSVFLCFISQDVVVVLIVLAIEALFKEAVHTGRLKCVQSGA